jgi:hypothetical protein
VADSAGERSVVDDDSGLDVSEKELIARVAANRRARRDTTQNVRALLKVASEANRAALDRLAQ